MRHKYIMYDPAEFDKIEIKPVDYSMGDDEYCEGQKSNCPELTRLRTDLAAVTEERDRLREALIDTTASLVASVSLLERGGKKAAPSDNMFSQMLVDYKNSIDSARAALEGVTEPPTGDSNA